MAIHSTLSWTKAFRLPEVMLMSGFFIIGSFFAIDSWSPDVIRQLFILWLISFFTILSVYSYNSAAGKTADQYNIRLEPLKKYTAKHYMIFGSIFFVIALCFSLAINPWFVPLNMVVLLIWIFYSHPKWGLKHKAYWGTVLHFIAQMIHFNMFYFAFKVPDTLSLILSVYFALAFSVGHLNHEIIDFHSDKEAGVTNTATKKGIRFAGWLVLFICLFNILFVLFAFQRNIINPVMLIFLLSPLIIHLFLYLLWFNQLNKYARRIRTFYRIVYLICFLLLIILRILESA